MVAPCKCARAETRAPDNHSNLIAVALVGHLKYVNARHSNTQPQSVDSPPVSRVSPVHSPGTDPALHGPRRRAEPTESTCGEAANLHGESPLGAHARLPIMHALRPIALVAARAASPHPALTHRRPPHSAGRYLCNGITLDGTAPHRAHRHAPRASASRASSPRSMAPRSTAPRATAQRSTRSAFASSRWLCL